MSALTTLLRQVKQENPQLAAELSLEVKELTGRRAFGLNFERHIPETIELPKRPVRRGDKVRFVPSRGRDECVVDGSLWMVAGFSRVAGRSMARLIRRAKAGSELKHAERAVEDLVVVAEFRDPIYPGLVSTGIVERGAEKPFHTVINAENFHALESLLYTHEGRVDVVYIDPPYNTGARDWKYNNDYVDGDDLYRHSKWLAFMERRLRLSSRLMNHDNSVLIVTIDEREYLRLGLLLEQVFPAANITMISSVINPKGTGRVGDFARTNEYLFFVRFGSAQVGVVRDESSLGSEVAWETMRRRNLASVRGRKGRGACGPNQFYPIFVSKETGSIVGRGASLALGQSRDSVRAPEGAVAVFPVRPDGTEMNWEYKDEAFDKWWSDGFIRANGPRDEPQQYVIQHIPNKARQEIALGSAAIEGHRQDGSVIARYVRPSTKTVTTQWNYPSHSAEHYGTGILKQLMPDRTFPFPKSLYAVEDAIRLFVADKPRAVVVDFFAGSGTTAHAVMRLNRQDGGRRQSILVTNNEVSASEQAKLRMAGLRAGDAGWEALGICEYITKPRLTAAVTGRRPDDQPIEGTYRFTDEFPMADGFEENVEFFRMTYEALLPVAHNRSFEAIAPLLWMRAGSEGRRIQSVTSNYDVADTYGVLFDLDCSSDFVEAVAKSDRVKMAFIVTDDERGYQMVCSELPSGVQTMQLYESYLTNFSINARGD